MGIFPTSANDNLCPRFIDILDRKSIRLSIDRISYVKGTFPVSQAL